VAAVRREGGIGGNPIHYSKKISKSFPENFQKLFPGILPSLGIFLRKNFQNFSDSHKKISLKNSPENYSPGSR
jgi:hypothetical protein